MYLKLSKKYEHTDRQTHTHMHARAHTHNTANLDLFILTMSVIQWPSTKINVVFKMHNNDNISKIVTHDIMTVASN